MTKSDLLCRKTENDTNLLKKDRRKEHNNDNEKIQRTKVLISGLKRLTKD
jgi:hypothetical protein